MFSRVHHGFALKDPDRAPGPHGQGSTKKLAAAWQDTMRRSGIVEVDASPALAAVASVKTRKELAQVCESTVTTTATLVATVCKKQ
jgi:hypothetical protein